MSLPNVAIQRWNVIWFKCRLYHFYMLLGTHSCTVDILFTRKIETHFVVTLSWSWHCLFLGEHSFFLDRKYIRLGLGSLSLSEWSAVEALRARSTMTKLSAMTKSAITCYHDQECSIMLHAVELINFKQQPSQNHNTTLQAYPPLLWNESSPRCNTPTRLCSQH